MMSKTSAVTTSAFTHSPPAPASSPGDVSPAASARSADRRLARAAREPRPPRELLLCFPAFGSIVGAPAFVRTCVWTRSNPNPNPVPGTLGRKKPPVGRPGDAPGDEDAEVFADPSADAGNDDVSPPLNDELNDVLMDASPPGPRARRASSGLGLGGTIPLGAT